MDNWKGQSSIDSRQQNMQYGIFFAKNKAIYHNSWLNQINAIVFNCLLRTTLRIATNNLRSLKIVEWNN